MNAQVFNSKPGLSILEMLRPHRRELWLGLAIASESIAGVLAPWPLKIVLGDLLQGKNQHGWIHKFIIATGGSTPRSIPMFACIAVLVIAVTDPLCTYAEKYLTTNVGQWIAHDLHRR